MYFDDIKHDKSEIIENVPQGITLASIIVDVVITPQDGTCIIYGLNMARGVISKTIMGSKARIKLDFSQPDIAIKYLGATTNVTVKQVAWEDARVD